MNFKFAIVASLTCSFALAAPVPKELRKPSDHVLILGTWEVVSRGHGGKLEPHRHGNLCEFSEDKFVLSQMDHRLLIAGYKLFAGPARGPKQLDWTVGKLTCPGVYSLEGDTLTIALTIRPDAVRPTDVKPGEDLSFLVMKRKAAPKKQPAEQE